MTAKFRYTLSFQIVSQWREYSARAYGISLRTRSTVSMGPNELDWWTRGLCRRDGVRGFLDAQAAELFHGCSCSHRSACRLPPDPARPVGRRRGGRPCAALRATAARPSSVHPLSIGHLLAMRCGLWFIILVYNDRSQHSPQSRPTSTTLCLYGTQKYKAEECKKKKPLE